MEKFKGKYRIPSARAPFWNYGWNGLYFVTICTKDMHHYFGKVENGTMQFSKIGEIALNNWNLIASEFTFIKLREFVVMPNHVHGILEIDHGVNGEPIGNQLAPQNGNTPRNHAQALNGRGGITGSMNPMLHKNLSRVIRWYKGAVTYDARIYNPSFRWQSRYHDHIIKNQEGLERISKYILENPQNWDSDKFHSKKN